MKMETIIRVPWEFSGSPVVRTLRFHCLGPWFNPWLGNQDPAIRVAQPKKKEKEKV